MSNIYLLRHAETDWNREDRLQGTLDVPINAAGVQQSCTLARRLQKRRIGRVFTSPLLRARQTAAIIASNRECDPSVHDDLRELDHGVWSGKTMKTLKRLYPSQVEAWRFEPEKLRIDRAEPPQDAYIRAARFLRMLLETPLIGNVLVVGHGVTNSLILCAAAGAPIGDAGKFAQSNGSIAVLHAQGRMVISVGELNDEPAS